MLEDYDYYFNVLKCPLADKIISMTRLEDALTEIEDSRRDLNQFYHNKFMELMKYNLETNKKRKNLISNYKSMSNEEINSIQSELDREHLYFISEMDKLSNIKNYDFNKFSPTR